MHGIVRSKHSCVVDRVTEHCDNSTCIDETVDYIQY